MHNQGTDGAASEPAEGGERRGVFDRSDRGGSQGAGGEGQGGGRRSAMKGGRRVSFRDVNVDPEGSVDENTPPQ